MSVSSYDELNIRPNNRRSEPYKEYFSKMSTSDKEKQERIAFSEQMEEVVLYILALIETTIESGETNREYIQTQFYDKYLNVVLGYMLIDSYIKEYVLETSKQIIGTTFSHIVEKHPDSEQATDDYYLSNDRAMFISECEANSILNYRQYSKALKSGKTKKTWIDVGDKRERKTHLEVGGTTIPINEPFSVGDSLLMFPTDHSLGASADEIVNCWCSIQYS
uniref:Minor capsid component n=1 Tax=virus sp. ctEfN2 TaxID=2825810 RepID=A0A8S5RMT5_9VIRU|nr:MAG TPA: minor capsid component [virus sp. ctEfN2]